MRIQAVTIVCAAMALAISLLGSPAAHADDASFMREVKALGFQQASANLITTAQSTCYLLGPRHRDPAQVEERIARYLNVTPDLAHQFSVLAVNEYCP